MSKSVVLITGAAGWLGGLLAHALTTDVKTPNLHLILADIVEPKAPNGSNAITFKADLCDRKCVEKLFQTDLGCPDTIYALHGIMSRQAEDAFWPGLKVNIDSIRLLLDVTIEQSAKVFLYPKFIFTSSLAVYGGPLPPVVTPETATIPESAYGMEKLTSELLINEYSRRGWVDGRILRLPTIVVRPGPPSAATSAFISGIIREPLKGIEAVCPIGDSLDSPELTKVAAWLASPEITIKNFVQAKHIPAGRMLGHTRVVCLPGFTATFKDELEALGKVAGSEVLKLVKFHENPTNKRVVSSWPAAFDNTYPLSLGFQVDEGGMIPIIERFKEAVDLKTV